MKIVLAALTLAFLLPQADSLKIGVPKGTKLTTSNSMSLEAELKSASIKVGGREIPPEVIEKFEMRMSETSEEQFEDEYVSVDGARPTELVRKYQKASQNVKQNMIFPGAKPVEEDKTDESPLLDHTVVFNWDEKAEKYERAFRGDKGEDSWLEKLEARMDFAQLLPSGKVEVGDTWKIDEKAFEAITSPGGSLSYPKKSKDDDDPLKDEHGTIEARYDGKREVEGRELYVIHVHADVSAAHEPKESDEMPMHLAIQLDLEGDYLWDSERGRLASFVLEGPARITLSASREIDAKDQKVQMEMKFELGGTCKVAGKIE
jgi:hypothetical protein